MPSPSLGREELGCFGTYSLEARAAAQNAQAEVYESPRSRVAWRPIPTSESTDLLKHCAPNYTLSLQNSPGWDRSPLPTVFPIVLTFYIMIHERQLSVGLRWNNLVIPLGGGT